MTRKITGRFLAISLFLTVATLVTGTAQAEKFIVTFKDPAAFSQVHSQFVLQQVLELNKVSFFSSLNAGKDKKPVLVEDSLKNLGSVIIDTDDKAQIAALKMSNLIAAVETEKFYPAPLPVRGFRKWTAWSSENTQVMKMRGPVTKERPSELFSNVNKATYGVGMVKAPEAWALAGRGAGARVLILDTGMDVNHPVLKQNFEKGRDFTRSNESSDVTDEVGHGTHVAGTVAGAMLPNGFSGVAPEAHILMGRVCGIRGCSNIAVARGINWGIEEKVDVISMSLGGDFSTSSEQRAILQAEASGITVIAASGNDGTGHVGAPASYPSVIAVGAVMSNERRAEFSQYGPELDVMAPGMAVVSTIPAGKGREAIVEVTDGIASRPVLSAMLFGAPVSTTPVSSDVIEAVVNVQGLLTSTVAGKIVLVLADYGNALMPTLQQVVRNGAIGILLYGSRPGLPVGGSSLEDAGLPIPIMMIEQSVGLELSQRISSGETAFAKIELIATDYASFDGTSMAAPHVAGVAALVKAANKNLTPEEVRTILKSTAKQIGLASEYGSGLVDAEAAVKQALGI